MTGSQLIVPCASCGMHSDDEHHSRIGAGPLGKGSGGTSLDDAEHFHHVALCRACHSLVHDRRVYIEIADDGSVTTIRESGVTVRDMRTDEELCDEWVAGDRLGKQGIAMQARVALAFRERYAALDEKGWYKRIAEIIRDTTGQPVSVGTVFDRCALGVALRAVGEDAEQALNHLGVKLMTTVGKQADIPLALEQANELRDGGESMNRASRAVAKFQLDGDSARGRVQLVESERSYPCSDGCCVCRWCGQEFG